MNSDNAHVTPQGNSSDNIKPAYHRPNLNWECGRACDGCVCRTGPNRFGKCSQVEDPCTPKPTLRLRRRRFAIGCVLLMLGVLIAANYGQWKNDFYAPGPLTSPHAQILNRTTNSNRCAECHGAGSGSPLDWVKDMLSCGKHCRTTQTDLCLKCHQNKIPPAVARLPHNVSLAELDKRTSAQPSRNEQHGMWMSLVKASVMSGSTTLKTELACSDCHKEHHGAGFDLKTMTDQQCQSCHKNSFHSFADGHPEFRFEKSRRRTRIAFDHAAHSGKYFSQKNKTFACGQCHIDDPQGNVKLLANYSKACAECHDPAIQVAADTGFPFLAVPTIPHEQLTAAGHALGDWPAAASGDFDGKLPPFLVLLLSADDKAAPVLKSLAPEYNLSHLNPEKPADLATGATIAFATKRLFADLAVQGEPALVQRIETILQRKLKPDERSTLFTQLPIGMFAESARRWFPSSIVAQQPGDSPTNNVVREPSSQPLPTQTTRSFEQPETTFTAPKAIASAKSLGLPWLLASFQATGETLAENPLAGRAAATAQSASPKPTPSTRTPTTPAPSVSTLPNNTNSIAPAAPTIRAAQGGELLAENPIRSRQPAAATITTLPTQESTPPANTEPVVAPSEKQPVAATNSEPAANSNQTAEPPAPAVSEPPSTPITTQAALPTPEHWRRDDTTLTIAYQPSGHGDEWFVAWLNLALSVPNLSSKANPVSATLVREPMVAACIRCHSVDHLKSLDAPDRTQWHVNWKTELRDPHRKDFTRFSHKPHAFQPHLQDCRHCHQMNEQAGVMANYASHEPIATKFDFHPPTKAACASCHNEKATSQSCTLCHFYHISGF